MVSVFRGDVIHYSGKMEGYRFLQTTVQACVSENNHYLSTQLWEDVFGCTVWRNRRQSSESPIITADLLPNFGATDSSPLYQVEDPSLKHRGHLIASCWRSLEEWVRSPSIHHEINTSLISLYVCMPEIYYILDGR